MIDFDGLDFAVRKIQGGTKELGALMEEFEIYWDNNEWPTEEWFKRLHDIAGSVAMWAETLKEYKW